MQSNQDRLISDLKKLKEYYKKHQKQSDITFDYIGFYVLDKLAIDLLGFSFEPFSVFEDPNEIQSLFEKMSCQEINSFNTFMRDNYEDLFVLFNKLNKYLIKIDYPTLPFYKLISGYSEKDFTDILLSFFSRYGNDMYKLVKKYMDEDRIVMSYNHKIGEENSTAMHIGSKKLKSGYIIMQHRRYNDLSLSSLVHELGHAYDRESFIYPQQKKLREFEDYFIEVPSSYFELEFYDYLIEQGIHVDGANILKNDRYTYMDDAFPAVCSTDKSFFEQREPSIILNIENYEARSKVRKEIIYGIGIYTALHLQYLRENMSYKEFMKLFYDFISLRKERTLQSSIEGLGINYEDFINGTIAYPKIEESSLSLKRRFKIYE